MDRSIGSTENARTAREVVLVDPVTGAPTGGSGPLASQVQGPAANKVTAVGNPVPAGLRYKASLDGYNDGEIGYATMNSKGALLICTDQLPGGDGQSSTPAALTDRLGAGRVLATANYVFNGTGFDRRRGDATGGAWVQGPAADNAAAAGNPLWAGAKYFVSTQAYGDGDIASLQANANGILMVGAPSSVAADAVGNTLTYMNDKAGGARPLATASFVFNGTAWDRPRTVAVAPIGTGSVDQPLWAASDLTGLRINVSASGDTPLVAAVASQTTRVHRMRLSPAGSVVVQIKDGATVLEAFNYTAGDPCIILEFSSRPYYKTAVNTALNINLSGAVQVDGRIEYVTSA